MDRVKKQLVRGRTKRLMESDKRCRDIYDVIFSDRTRIFGQYTKKGVIVKVSFGELEEKIRYYAYYIHKNFGTAHRYVGLDSENCVSWVAAFWGIIMSGNRPYLVNCKHPETLKKNLLKTMNVSDVIGAKSHDLGCKYTEYAEIEGEFERYSENEAEISETVRNLYEKEFENEFALSSSATSMNETVCIFTGEEMANSILNVDFVLENNKRMPKYYRGALRQLAFLPFYHIYGFSAVYMWFTFYGCTMVFLENYSGDTITKTVRDHMVTHIFAVPLLWNTMENRIKKQVELKGEKTVKKFEKGLALSEKIQKIAPYAGEAIAKALLREVTDKTLGRSIKFCISGGAGIKESTLKFFNCLGYPLHNGYGMTETGITSVCLEKNIREREKNSVGFPFPSVKYTIKENGVLRIEGTSVCRTRIVNGTVCDTNGVIETADIFTQDKYGYHIMGRENDLIIGADGENINPDVLEKSFDVPFMQRYCIFGEKDGDREFPSMVVELKNICTPAQVRKTVEEVRQQAEKLPNGFRPVNIYYTYDLIASEQAIKISRNYLKKGIEEGRIRLIRQEELNADDVRTEEFDETTELAKLVRGIIAEALNRSEEEILPDANVMTELGGSSLDYFYIMQQLSDRTGIALYTDENRCPYTLREFCREIEAQM